MYKIPLKALLNNEIIYSWNLTESHRKLLFKCHVPECNEEMRPVMGKIKIKHFRHKSGQAHGEHESREHLQAKMWVKRMCDKLSISCDLEHYMKMNGKIHILDCLVGKNVGIEVQASGIAEDMYNVRNKFYRRNGITPIWILVISKTYDPWKTTDKEYYDKYLQRIKKIEKRILKDKGRILYLDVCDDDSCVLYKSTFTIRPDITSEFWTKNIIPGGEILEEKGDYVLVQTTSKVTTLGWFELDKEYFENIYKPNIYSLDDLFARRR